MKVPMSENTRNHLQAINAHVYDVHVVDHLKPSVCYDITFFFTLFFQLYCPNGIFSLGNSGFFPREKPAATQSRYPTYGALVFP